MSLVVKFVVPDSLNFIPVGNNAMLDRLFQGQGAPVVLDLVTHVRSPSSLCPTSHLGTAGIQ